MDSFLIQMIKYHPGGQGVLSTIAPGMALPPTSLWSNAGNDVNRPKLSATRGVSAFHQRQ
jgi:hypothetical protein